MGWWCNLHLPFRLSWIVGCFSVESGVLWPPFTGVSADCQIGYSSQLRSNLPSQLTQQHHTHTTASGFQIRVWLKELQLCLVGRMLSFGVQKVRVYKLSLGVTVWIFCNMAAPCRCNSVSLIVPVGGAVLSVTRCPSGWCCSSRPSVSCRKKLSFRVQKVCVYKPFLVWPYEVFENMAAPCCCNSVSLMVPVGGAVLSVTPCPSGWCCS